MSLHPAEHRAVRELHATARALASHWSALAARLGEPSAEPLRAGAATSRALLEALSYRSDLPAGYPAAQGTGGGLAAFRGLARDVVSERNQALRLALVDARHVTVLLGYLAALADAREDAELAAFHREWQEQMGWVEEAVSDAVLVLAGDPDLRFCLRLPGLWAGGARRGERVRHVRRGVRRVAGRARRAAPA